MAKYTVTYRCGHTAEIVLFGKLDDRERKIAYYATIDCPECKARNSHVDGLPELTGSVKQIAWAADIRREFKAIAKTIRARMATVVGYDDKKKELESIFAEIESNETAKYWIDNRYYLDSESGVNDLACKMSKSH